MQETGIFTILTPMWYLLLNIKLLDERSFMKRKLNQYGPNSEWKGRKFKEAGE